MVPFSEQFVPEATRRLSTVAAPMLPRQTRSSADAGAAVKALMVSNIPATATPRFISDLPSVSAGKVPTVRSLAAGVIVR
jgi:hypothetical protein